MRDCPRIVVIRAQKYRIPKREQQLYRTFELPDIDAKKKKRKKIQVYSEVNFKEPFSSHRVPLEVEKRVFPFTRWKLDSFVKI